MFRNSFEKFKTFTEIITNVKSADILIPRIFPERGEIYKSEVNEISGSAASTLTAEGSEFLSNAES